MKESKKNILFALISLALNHLISMNNSRTKLLNYALHSFQFFVLKEDENITTSAWQKFLRFYENRNRSPEPEDFGHRRVDPKERS